MANTAPFIALTTPITDASLQMVSLHGVEEISRPFDYSVTLRSTNAAVDFSSVLGQPVVVAFTAADDTVQHLNGVAVEFSQDEQDARQYTVYTARLRPTFWLLSLRSDYVIYQNKSIPDIIKAAFSTAGFTDFRDDTTQTYSALVYVVQYGESTMDFVSRLMEEAGIFYFFEHTASACTLVMADDASLYGTLPGTSTLPFGAGGGASGEDNVVYGSMRQQVVPTSFKLNDYNFTAPATSLLSTSSGATTYQLSEFPGRYLVKADGEALASLRLTEHETRTKLFVGGSTASNLHAGYQFTLSGHPRSEANAAWAILALQVHIENDVYTNEFTAFPASITFRPERVTARPRIAGTQTAIVTGKAGEEIWTDQYGRVKVKFPWDGSAASDETTSCWVRVAQAWAGKAYGSLSTPRIGAEVVVTFLEGDPDQPLVVGTVYNATQTTPYTLPGDQTKSTMKTNSSKGGSGYNELRFEDKAGSEEVYLQAQKDMKVNVVKGDYSLAVATGNELHSTKGTRGITVEGNETRTNKADFKQDITGKNTVTTTGDEKQTNKANFERDVTGNYTLKVTGDLVIKATGSVTIESGTGFVAKAGTSMAVSGGTSAGVKAGTQLALEGSATAELKGGGQTAIKGGIVQIN